ncbi:phage tail assembly protein [Schinkia sp. CFF1]
MEVKLTKPINLDGKEIKKLELKLEELTGEDILKVDLELRTEGNLDGLNTIHNQNVLIKLASKSSGIIVDDFKKLSAPDFLEVTFSVRNFLLGLSAQPVPEKISDES